MSSVLIGGSSGDTASTTLTVGVAPENYSFTLSRQLNVTATRTLVDYNSLVAVDATAGAVVLTLPSGRAAGGKLLVVVKTDTTGNTVTFTPISGESVFAPTGFSSLSTRYATVMFIGVTIGATSGWLKVA
jgi:hypothetical protein